VADDALAAPVAPLAPVPPAVVVPPAVGIGPLDEFARIERFFCPLAAGFAGALSLEDDAALVTVPPGQELVITTDAMVAGRHFLPEDAPEDVAIKLLRVNLSDLAAMGATPLAYTLITSLPREIDEAWLARFAGGLAEDQRRFGLHLIGGDSVSTQGPVTVSITAFGLVAAGRALKRKGAAVGDSVFVTGTIGDALLGLHLALGNPIPTTDADRAWLLERLRRPVPRVALAHDLIGLASAAIDVSDGLVADFSHLCAASGVAGLLGIDRLPLSPAASAVVQQRPEMLPVLLAGGDDYELLFTAPPEHAPALVALGVRHGVPITEVGSVNAAASGGTGNITVFDATGRPVPLGSAGWTHF